MEAKWGNKGEFWQMCCEKEKKHSMRPPPNYLNHLFKEIFYSVITKTVAVQPAEGGHH